MLGRSWALVRSGAGGLGGIWAGSRQRGRPSRHSGQRKRAEALVACVPLLLDAGCRGCRRWREDRRGLRRGPAGRDWDGRIRRIWAREWSSSGAAGNSAGRRILADDDERRWAFGSTGSRRGKGLVLVLELSHNQGRRRRDEAGDSRRGGWRWGRARGRPWRRTTSSSFPTGRRRRKSG